MLKLKKLFLSKLDFLFKTDNKKFNKYNTCLYKITKYINKGSQGKIFKGYNRITKNIFAVKIIKKRKQKYIKNERRFYNCNINHINIINYHNFFNKNKNFHIIMDYCPQDLYSYFTQIKYKLNEKEVKLILVQIINALYYLSENHNIYHTDVKLENIMLEKKNELSSIKLIDFSNYIKIPENNDFTIIPSYEYGTLEYIAPELVIGKFYKTSDVWSIGVLIYLLLTDTFIQDEYLVLKTNQFKVDNKLIKLKKKHLISNDFYSLLWKMFRIDPLERITLKELKDKMI